MRGKIAKFIQNTGARLGQSSRVKKVSIILVLVIAGFWAGKKVISTNKDGYIFDTVQKRTITETVTESGTVIANGRVGIYSPTNGVVDVVFVANGEAVLENHKLFTVKSTASSQEKAAAYSDYEAAKAAVQQAENTRRSTQATVDRVHDDLKNKDDTETFTEKETRTTAEVANDNAYDALLAARARLSSAQAAYQATQDAIVTAPISGMIANLSVIRGSNVSINSQLAPVSPVLIIGGLGMTEIMIGVGETDINKIKTGQEAEIKLNAVSDKIYKGVVARFDENGTITQGVVKFNTYIQITDTDDRIKPGMTADVDIITNKLADVLSVPNTAVKPYQKGRAVRKLNSKGKLEYIPVKTGIRGKEFTQIVGGLEESQEIVVSLTNEKTTRNGIFGI
jgi:RND family efflux transporter MFP subunit